MERRDRRAAKAEQIAPRKLKLDVEWRRTQWTGAVEPFTTKAARDVNPFGRLARGEKPVKDGGGEAGGGATPSAAQLCETNAPAARRTRRR